ncbi:MAG: type II toxin-antitoxin system ParD family antitoxin [Phycisphaerales bacterium]
MAEKSPSAGRGSALRVPDASARWLDRLVDSGLHSSRAAAVEHLIRQARVAESRAALEAQVRAGLRSGPGAPLTAKLLRDIERRGMARLEMVSARAGVGRKKSA